ncbi:hypothetical protein GCM10019059_21900 [Camelimonas fluminis]|uniref:Uncharacterized protein n=1 Tax=Camelimonas fluminis TaxID=1576911 RepID=A0ABV7UFJ2_9HYPH|nr:hypothetical protein [Camelimonas fluminis]GHE62035.1 hypothetical protein GCM10019059_21900 [Camelimonas fluminis]
MASPSVLESRGRAAQNFTGRLSLQRQRQLFLARHPDNGINHKNVPGAPVRYGAMSHDFREGDWRAAVGKILPVVAIAPSS